MLIFPRIVLIVLSSLYCINSSALDLNGDGVGDDYKVLRDSSAENYDVSVVQIKNGATGKVSKAQFSLGNGGLSPGYYSGDFFVHLDFDVRDPEQLVYGFRWTESIQDWVLYKVSKWSEPARSAEYTLEGEKVPEDKILPRGFEVKRVKCCVRFSGFGFSNEELVYKGRSESDRDILEEFGRVSASLGASDRAARSLFFYTEGEYKNPPPDLMYEFSEVLGSSNVKDMNSYAYYLVENGANASAAILLKAIHDKYPKRIAAGLNVADVYWGLGMKKTACGLYSEYLNAMVDLNKASIIPARVGERARCNGK